METALVRESMRNAPQYIRLALNYSTKRSSVCESQEPRGIRGSLLDAAPLTAEFRDSDLMQAILGKFHAQLASCSSTAEALQLAIAALFAAA